MQDPTHRGDTLSPPVGLVTVLDAGGRLVGDDYYLSSLDIDRCNALLGLLHPESDWYVRPEHLESEQLEREIDRVRLTLYDGEPDARAPMVAAVLRVVLAR